MAIKKIDDNLTVTLLSNFDGGIFLKSRNGDVLVDTNEYGELADIAYEDLKRLVNSNRNIFKDLLLVIVDIDNNEDYELEDVYKALRLEKEYKSIKRLEEILDKPFDDYSLDEFIEESDFEDFKELLETPLRKSLMSKAVVLYRDNRLNDYQKMKLVGDNARAWYREPQTFWNDVEVSPI